MKSLLVFLCALTLAAPSFAMGVRAQDVGQGNAPGFMLEQGVELDDNKAGVVGFGFIQLDGENYRPFADLTFFAENLFGRVGVNSEWNPMVSVGMEYGVTARTAFEFTYGWGFAKTPEELSYVEAKQGALMLNFKASF